MLDKNLETFAYRLKDMSSLRNLFSELNYDFKDLPVNKDGWSEAQKNMVVESRIIVHKNDYLIFYIQTNTDSIREWKGIATKIIKANNGSCMVCSHNPSGFKWIFSSLSKEFSKSFSETRHVPIELKPDSGVPKTFVEFLDKIRVDSNQTAASIVNKISDAFDSFAIQIHDELTINVFEALKILSEGIILNKSNKLLLNENTLEEIRESTFILLYRIMFVLYAEDRSVFPNSQFYYDNFSLKWIKKEWVLKDTAKIIGKYDVQERLNKLFRLIEVGSEEMNYKHEKFFMRSYYGRLFDRKVHSKLEKWKIPNENLLKAIELLTRTHDKKGNYFFLDYSALETRHLGAIYEHLLEFHLTVKNNKVADLPNPKERKSTGSYYTPKYIVDYIVENTVGPLIDDIVKNTKEPSEQIDKILDLNILDPAMGSGHFLVGAVSYIASRLCLIEYAEDKITEQAFVERKRDVARRCIYGVDINPLAVDLAQVSLWLETLSSEKPLSFLSAHLKTGNSLIGSSINDILEKQTTLIESTTSRESFKKNVRDFIMLEMLDDDTAESVKSKTVKYDNMQSKGSIYSELKLLLDAKVAKNFGIDVPPLGDYVNKIGKGALGGKGAKGHVWLDVKRAAEEYSFFHWDLEFPDIFYNENGKQKENPGFDGVVGNPPWDILKPDIEEFFAPIYEQKHDESFRQLTKMKKNKFVKLVLQDTTLLKKWEEYEKEFKIQIKYFNESHTYKFQASIINGKKQASDINLYKLFLEKTYNIVANSGLCGLVIPAGLYSDMGTRKLRELFFENTKIKSLYSFINKKGIFDGVHRQFKFCLFVFKKNGNTNNFFVNFYIENPHDVKTLHETSFEINLDLIQLCSPTALSIIECKNKQEVTIFEKLYQNPILSSEEWQLQARSEFHMTNNSDLFHTRKTGLPLYEGKMIYQFLNTLLSPTYYINEKIGTAHLIAKEQKRINKKNKQSTVKPEIDFCYYRLVWRDVTNAVDHRTLISTILPPKVFLGNTLSYIIPMMFDGNEYVETLTTEEMIYLCGILNSFPIDFILRHRVNLHVSIFHLMELPIPKFDNKNKLHLKIVQKTTQLVCTTNEFNELRQEINVKSATRLDERLKLQAQINALSAKIYGLEQKELELILQYFSIESEDLKQKTLNEFIII